MKQELVYMEKFCLKVGFNERQTAMLISGKPLFYKGELYSEEHRRKFTTEEAGFQVAKDPKDKSKLALAINGQVIGEWFKEQFGRLFPSVKRTVEPLAILSWLKRHFICARILLKLACVMPK